MAKRFISDEILCKYICESDQSILDLLFDSKKKKKKITKQLTIDDSLNKQNNTPYIYSLIILWWISVCKCH